MTDKELDKVWKEFDTYVHKTFPLWGPCRQTMDMWFKWREEVKGVRRGTTEDGRRGVS